MKPIHQFIVLLLVVTGFGVKLGLEKFSGPNENSTTNPNPLQRRRSTSNSASSAHLGIPLEEALKNGIVKKAEVIQNDVSRGHVRLLLTPGNQEGQWITIQAGWRADNPHESNADFVSYWNTRVQLLEDANTGIWLKAVPVHPHHVMHIQSKNPWILERLHEKSKLGKLLHQISQERIEPHWKSVQLAVWAVHADPDFKTILKRRYGRTDFNDGTSVVSLSGVHYALDSANRLDESLRLLKKAGYEKSDFRYYRQAEDFLSQRIDAYYRKDKPLQAVYDIGRFVDWEDSLFPLTQVFENHPGRDGVPIREASFDLLKAKIAHPKVKTSISRAIASETDTKLKTKMETAIKAVQ